MTETDHLIAAAPDLLAAIERHLIVIEHWLETGECISPEESESIYNQLKAAALKARGLNHG